MRALVKQLASLLLGFMLGSLLTFYQCLENEQEVVPVTRQEYTEGREGGCVCGDAADELRRMSKISLFVSKLDIANNKNSSKVFSDGLELKDEGELRQFLYPNTSQAPAQLTGTGQHRLLQEEYLFKKMVFVGVLTQQSYLATRARYLYETWGREVDGLIFFVGEDCEIPASLSYLPIVKLEGIKDNVYPPLKKTFAVLQYMYDNYLHQYNWFIRADDDMYVRTRKLKELLSQMHPYEKVYLGRAGTGRDKDLDRLNLLPHERYCMGGPGIILSMAALRNLGPHLVSCLSAGRARARG